jgi:hypothetical protein
MMDRKTIGLLVRTSKNRSRAAGLNPRRLSVQSSLLDRRKARGTAANRASSRCSEHDAGVKVASSDRAQRREDAYVQGYHVWRLGQTGIRSSSIFCFPELAAGREVTR